MKDERFFQGKDVGYQLAAYTGKNESGLTPIGDLVLVMTDEVDGFAGTKKAIIMLDTNVEQQNGGATSGRIVELGMDAFVWSADRKRPFGEDKPKIGDRVLFTRYSGLESFGADAKRYRVMSDNCISAVIKETSSGL